MSIALLDGDVIAYRSCFGAERTYKSDDPEEEGFSAPADLGIAKAIARRIMTKWVFGSHCLTGILFLSGMDSHWRRGVFAPYKGQRREKPELFEPLREWMVQDMNARRQNGLEGDDLLAIEATECLARYGVEKSRVICSIDKDLGTVPGWWWDAKTEGGPVFVSYRQSILEHMTQTLVGDSADNYPGCPGIGPVRARALLSPPHERQPNRFILWRRVVQAFESRGLGEAEALTQARISRILRWREYRDGRVRLWTPPGNRSCPTLDPLLSLTFPTSPSTSCAS